MRLCGRVADMGRRAARVDANQSEIVRDLRKLGCSVLDLSAVGKGCPDILVSRQGRSVLMEIKDGNKPPSARKLRPQQITFHNAWQGEVVVVNDVDEALGVMGIELRGVIS